MGKKESNFLKSLSRSPTEQIPLYCTGFPEHSFMEKYIKAYNLKSNNQGNLILSNEDYSLISNMGFDSVSLWEFRREKGEYYLDSPKNTRKVDGWGRIYQNQWYSWDGMFKSEAILEKWALLTLPSKESLNSLKKFFIPARILFDPILSLPGLFEKTWQSMGYKTFSLCLKKNLSLVEKVIDFFYRYLLELIKELQDAGADLFLVADDCAYKNRTFLPNDLWKKLFFDKYKNIVDRLHSHDHKVIIHSDGYVSNLIDIFIQIGFDAVESLEPNAGVDVFDLFKKFRNQICFIGNLDVSTLLSFGNSQEVRNYVLKLIQKAKISGCSLILSPTQQILSCVHPENIKEMIETAKNYKLYLR